jgi:hypothetical protein
MGWYRVIKTVKGRRYEYLQRSWREGKKVRTESRYIGPAGDGNATARPPQASDFDGVITTPRVLYHGAREGIDGPPRASESGTFGPGLYLTVRDRAEVYARYDAKIAADVVNGRMAYPPPPKYERPCSASSLLPGGIGAEHGVERDHQLAHAGRERELGRLPGQAEPPVEAGDRRVAAPGGRHRGHVQASA